MGMIKHKQPKYDGPQDNRTKQSFKDACDINKILKKAQTHGALSHLQKYPEAVYGEFDGVDLLGAFQRIDKAKEIFAELPSEVRREFNNDAFAFVAFAANPENNSKLRSLLPAIAAPGSYFPNPAGRGRAGAGAATPSPQGDGPQNGAPT